jgi:hypothetical protein
MRCRLNDICDAPRRDCADSSIPVIDDSAIAQRKVCICYCEVGELLFDVLVKSVKNRAKRAENAIVTYTFSYTRNLGMRK